MKKILTLVLMAVLSLGLLTACGGGGGATVELTVVMGEGNSMEFEPNVLNVNKGETIKLTLINKDTSQQHSLLIPDLNFKSKQQNPNSTETYNISASKSGSFQFFCDVPGHKEAQMVGTINVK